MEEMLTSAERDTVERAHVPGWKLKFPRRVLRVVAPFWVIGLIVGSFLPGTLKDRLGTTAQPQSGHVVRQVALKHRMFHLASFGSTALILLVIAGNAREERKGAAFVLLLGCAIETLQCWQSNGVLFEWWDVRDDFYAVAAVFIMAQILNWLPEKPGATPRISRV
jgi:hypothetical protein